ncbi:MAG: hypothetical protein SYNGOMJ08_00580 [Candidatus Syntrophoarchaeum sp. GoM_oil]|nr:MAG: hypothetical protein SYNGOMJ08_00580 [Candidatus Syntrophoarchaeum sp. GoM_oil]
MKKKKLNIDEYATLLDLIEVAIITSNKVLIYAPKDIKEELAAGLDSINYSQYCKFDHYFSTTSVGINPSIRYILAIVVGIVAQSELYYKQQYDILNLDPSQTETDPFTYEKYIEMKDYDVANQIAQMIGRLRPYKSAHVKNDEPKHIIILSNLGMSDNVDTELFNDKQLKSEIELLRRTAIDAYIHSYFNERKDVTAFSPAQVAKHMNESLHLRSEDFIRKSLISYAKRQEWVEIKTIQNGHRISLFTRP